jgi:hypothetical protein
MLRAQAISRKDGRSAVAAAAYRAGEELSDERYGLVHDYSRKGGVSHSEIMAPPDAPGWVHDRERMWNEVEASEKRVDAQVAREVLVALPHELTHDQHVALVRDFVQNNFVARGMVADVSIHEPPREGDDRNHHAHIMLTTRSIGPEGFGAKNREWNQKEVLNEWRENWARTQNRHLENALGLDAPKVTHLSYNDQGLDQIPGTHLGPNVVGIERRGGQSFVAEEARQVANDNLQKQAQREKAWQEKEAKIPLTSKNLGRLDIEMKALVGQLEQHKPTLEKRLAEIQKEAKELRSKSSAVVRQATLRPFEAEEIKARKEFEQREKEAQAGRGLTAKAIMKWFQNPAAMLWKAAQEQLRRDSAANAAGSKLKKAQANKKATVEWLKTPDGKEFIKTKLAEIRAQAPGLYDAGEAVHRATGKREQAAKHMQSLKGKEMVYQKVKELQGGLSELRTEERKTRRNLAQLNRNIERATKVSHRARAMYENDIGGQILTPDKVLDVTRYVNGVHNSVDAKFKSLKPEQQQAVNLNLRRALGLGLGFGL